MSTAAPPLPAPDDKSGVKIDYVAKRLAIALTPLGFKRKGRLLTLAAGESGAAHWRIVHVQAGKWTKARAASSTSTSRCSIRR